MLSLMSAGASLNSFQATRGHRRPRQSDDDDQDIVAPPHKRNLTNLLEVLTLNGAAEQHHDAWPLRADENAGLSPVRTGVNTHGLAMSNGERGYAGDATDGELGNGSNEAYDPLFSVNDFKQVHSVVSWANSGEDGVDHRTLHDEAEIDDDDGMEETNYKLHDRLARKSTLALALSGLDFVPRPLVPDNSRAIVLYKPRPWFAQTGTWDADEEDNGTGQNNSAMSVDSIIDDP